MHSGPHLVCQQGSKVMECGVHVLHAPRAHHVHRTQTCLTAQLQHNIPDHSQQLELELELKRNLCQTSSHFDDTSKEVDVVVALRQCAHRHYLPKRLPVQCCD